MFKRGLASKFQYWKKNIIKKEGLAYIVTVAQAQTRLGFLELWDWIHFDLKLTAWVNELIFV